MNSLPDDAGKCPECGTPMQWVIGGSRCPRENDPNTHEAARDRWENDDDQDQD